MIDLPRLYLIVPSFEDGGDPSRLAAALDAGDVACVCLAEREPSRLESLIRIAQARGAAALIRNDMRLAEQADGVHLDTLAEIDAAVRRFRSEKIVGVSGLALRDDAMAAGEAGADYVMFGETSLGTAPEPFEERLERVAWWAEIFQIPCVAVAQEVDEITPLTEAGADFVALPGHLWARGESVAHAVGVAMAALQLGHGKRLAREAERV